MFVLLFMSVQFLLHRKSWLFLSWHGVTYAKGAEKFTVDNELSTSHYFLETTSSIASMPAKWYVPVSLLVASSVCSSE